MKKREIAYNASLPQTPPPSRNVRHASFARKIFSDLRLAMKIHRHGRFDKCLVDIYTDSQYVKQGMSAWIYNWRRNGWRTSDKKPIKNQDLWMALDELSKNHEVQWHWVRGHAGHPMNERADQLAKEALCLGLEQTT